MSDECVYGDILAPPPIKSIKVPPDIVLRSITKSIKGYQDDQKKEGGGGSTTCSQ